MATDVKQAIRQSADMSRNKDLAGQTVYKDGYNITYNDKGFATKAVKSDSPAYAGHKDQTVASSGGTTTNKNMWTDEQMLTAADLQKIADLRAQGAAGTISWAEANAQANAIRSGYGYTIDQSGTVVDQQAKERAEAAQQKYGATQVYDKATGTYQPIVSAPQTSVAGQQQTVTQTPGAGAQGGVVAGQQSGGASAGGVGDYSEYLKDLYAANMEAELAALEEAYKANVGTLETAGERIGQTYHAARNQAAAQNEVERRAAQEYFAARGLNTGAAGQMELSRSAALQGQLGALNAEEAQAVTDNQRAQDELARQYEAAVAQAKAENNASRAQALYEELIRQENAKLAAQMAAQEQANWEKQFAAQQQQYRDKLAQTQRAEDYEMAMAMLGAGIMPDSATLASAGISQTQASALQMLYQAQRKTASTSGGGKSGGSSGGSMSLTTAKAMMKAGQFTDAAVNVMLKAGFNEEYLRSEYGYGEQDEATKVPVTPPSYSEVTQNSTAGDYGPQFNMVMSKLQIQQQSGADLETLAAEIMTGLEEGKLTTAGAASLMQALGI